MVDGWGEEMTDSSHGPEDMDSITAPVLFLGWALGGEEVPRLSCHGVGRVLDKATGKASKTLLCS